MNATGCKTCDGTQVQKVQGRAWVCACVRASDRMTVAVANGLDVRTVAVNDFRPRKD